MMVLQKVVELQPFETGSTVHFLQAACPADTDVADAGTSVHCEATLGFSADCLQTTITVTSSTTIYQRLGKNRVT